MTPDFEEAFAPEIDAFTPPQINQDTSMPSPTSTTPVTPNMSKHQHQSSMSSANGATEVSTVQPVSLRQGRGARLSFLGGRKKELTQPVQTNGEPLANPSAGNGEPSKPHDSHRRSFFRAPPSFENQRPAFGVPSSTSNGTLPRSNTAGSDWVTESRGGSRASNETHIMSGTTSMELSEKERETPGGPGTPKLGAMKKRLSLLKLGKRTGRSNTMGALSEE